MKFIDKQLSAPEMTNRTSEAGRSVAETLMVIAVASLLASIAVPQLLSARRMIRTTAIPREIAAQMRYTRQQAMSQRQAFTFQYDNSTKTIKIFDHNNNNNATIACNIDPRLIMAQGGYPNTSCTTTVNTIPLATGPISPSELTYGIPTGINQSTILDDGNSMTALVGSVVNITFQPDGTVQDTNGNYAKPTLFLYNSNYPTQTSSAISVLGSAGRVKVWRYSTSASKYTE